MTSVFSGSAKLRRFCLPKFQKHFVIEGNATIAAPLMQKISLEELNMIQDIERCKRKKNMLKN